MLVTLDSFRLDVDRQEEGTWVSHPTLEGVTFLIARYSNPNHEKVMEQLTNQAKRQLEITILDKETDEKIKREAAARAVLLGWRGIYDPQTKEERPFTREGSMEIFMDDSLVLLRNWILQQSSLAANYMLEQVEHAGGN